MYQLWCFGWVESEVGKGFACGGIITPNSKGINRKMIYAVQTHKSDWRRESWSKLSQPYIAYIPVKSSQELEPKNIEKTQNFFYLNRIRSFADDSSSWSAYSIHHGDNIIAKSQVSYFLYSLVFEGGVFLLAFLLFLGDIIISFVRGIYYLFNKEKSAENG